MIISNKYLLHLRKINSRGSFLQITIFQPSPVAQYNTDKFKTIFYQPRFGWENTIKRTVLLLWFFCLGAKSICLSHLAFCYMVDFWYCLFYTSLTEGKKAFVNVQLILLYLLKAKQTLETFISPKMFVFTSHILYCIPELINGDTKQTHQGYSSL